MERKFLVRDTRNGDWSWVYNALIADPHLTPHEKNIYCALAGFAGCEEIRPSYKTLAERSVVSERMVKYGIKKLIKIGYVALQRKGGGDKANVYLLLKMPKGCIICTGRGANDDTIPVQPLHPNKISVNKISNKDKRPTTIFNNLNDADNELLKGRDRLIRKMSRWN